VVIRATRRVSIQTTMLNPSAAYLPLLTTPRTLCMMLVFRPKPELGGAEKYPSCSCERGLVGSAGTSISSSATSSATANVGEVGERLPNLPRSDC